ncbi:MAG: hypothetical protein II953_02225 [Clostridia bacterium]|nr:hypothetical protein [Clostridia bacterium]
MKKQTEKSRKKPKKLWENPLTTGRLCGIIPFVVEPKTAGYRKSEAATLPRRDA